MSQTVINFKYLASADDFFRTTDQVERRLSGLEKGAGLAGKAIQGAFAAVGFLAVQKGIELVGGAFSGSIGAAATFEQTMSGVKAVSNATGEEMDQLSSLALKLGKDTSFSASQAALGIEELVKGGLTVPDIMNGAAKATLNLAAAGGVDLATAAEIAANAVSVFGLKGADMAHVSDLIAGAANASSLSVTDFKFSLAAAGSMAAVAGLSIDDLSQAIAVMGAAGIKGSDAGTSIKTFLANLIPQTNEQKKLFRDLGLETDNLGAGFKFLAEKGIAVAGNSWPDLNKGMMQYLGYSEDVSTWTEKQRQTFDKLYYSSGTLSSAFFDQNGKMKSMAEVAGVLQTATANMTEQQKLATFQTLFGSDASRAAAIFAKSGAEGFNEMAGAMGKVTAESVGLERLNNTAGSIEQLKGSLETAGITIGRVFLPYGRKLIDWATGAVNGLIPLLETSGPLLAANLATGGRALLDFGKATIAILGPVKDAAGSLLTAFQNGDFNAAFGPLLAALDAAFGPGTSGKVALFVSQLLRGFQLVRDGFLTVQQALSGKWVGDDTVQPAVRAVGDFALRLRDFALTAKDVFFNQVLPAVQQVAGFIRDHMDTIAKVVAIGAAAFAAFSIISTVVGWVTSAIAIWGVLSVAIEGVGGIVAALVVVLGGPLTLAIAAIVGVVTLLGVAWANNWGDIQGKVTAVWAWLQPVLADLGARLSQFWTDILPQLSAAWESVSTKVVAAATWLWGMLQTVFGAVAGFLVAHGDQLVAVLGGAWSLIQNTINTYLGVISNLVRGVLALISGDWDGAWAYIRQAAQIAWDAIVALITTAGPLIGAALDGISATVTGWGVALHVWIGDQFSAIGATIRDRVTQYKNDTGQQFSEMGAAIQDKLAQIGTAIGGKFSEIGTTIHDRVAQYLVDTGQQFSDMGTIIHDRIARYITDTGQQFSDMGAAIRDQMTAIKNDVGDKFSALGAAIQGKLDDIQGWWRAGWSAVQTTVGDTWDGIKSDVGGAFSDLGSATKTFITVTIPGKFSDARQTVVDAVMGIFQGAGSVKVDLDAWMVSRTADVTTFIGTTVPKAFTDKAQDVRDAVLKIFDGAGSVKSDLVAWFASRITDVGTFIGTDLPAKFFAGQKAVRDKVMDVFEGNTGAVKESLTTWLNGRITDIGTFIGTDLPDKFFAGQQAVKDKFMDVFEGNTGAVREALTTWLASRITDVGTFIGTDLPGKFFAGQKAVRDKVMGVFEGVGSVKEGLDAWVVARTADVTTFIGTTVPTAFFAGQQAVKDKFMGVFEGENSVLAAFTAWVGTDKSGFLGSAWTFIGTTLPTTLGNGITAVVGKFSGIFSGEGGVGAAFTSWVGNDTSGFIGSAKTFVSVTLPGTFTAAFETVKSAFMGTFSGAAGIDAGFASWIGNGTSGFLGSANTFITTTLPKVFTDATKAVKDAVLSGFVAAAAAIEGIFNGFGTNAITSMNAILQKVRSFAEGVKKVVNWVAEKFGATQITDPVGDAVIKPMGQATGTPANWGGGMAWVGEGPGGAGAELAYLPKGAQVLPHRDSMALVRQGVVAAPQSGPALVPGFAGGLDALGGIFGVLQKGAGWLYEQAKGAVGLGDLSLPGSLGDIGGKLAGKVKDWALGSIDKMLKAATPVANISGDQIQRGIGFAEAQMGKPYIWGGGHGGSQPINADGWDCSGFVSAVLNAMGIPHPRYGIVTSFFDWMEQGPKTGYVDIGINNPRADPDVQHMGMALGGTQYESRGSDGGVKNGTTFQYWGHPPGLTGPPPKPTSTFGQGPSSGGTGGNWGDPSIAALDDYIGGGRALSGWGDLIKGDSADRGIPANLAMTIFGHESSYGSSADGLTKYNNFSGLTTRQGGWPGQTGVTTGMARDFAIFRSKQTGIDAALDNLGYYKGLSLRQTVAKWLTGDPNATADEKYTVKDYLKFAEETINTLGGSYDPDALRFADGGVITEPIVGRGQRSGRSYTFGENGKEGIFNADQLAALSPRGDGGGDTHISNYTIVSSTPEITVDQLKREERREARLRGYDR